MGPTLLAKYLKDADTTQAVFASRVGITQSTISALLRGERRAGLDVAHNIEKATRGAVPATAWLKRKGRRAA